MAQFLTTLRYSKYRHKFLRRDVLERYENDEDIDPETIGEEVAKVIDSIMDMSSVRGTITVKIEVGNNGE